MERIIVSLEEDTLPPRDLELPLEITVSELLQELSLAFGLRGEQEIFASPPERLLMPQETLAQAGLQDGARLFLRPRGSHRSFPVSAPPIPSSPAFGHGPLAGWRPLENLPVSSSPPSENPSRGFQWQRIDED